jgi:hypothetical protein
LVDWWVFTKLATERISDGLGGFVVEGSAALTIAAYLAWLWLSGRWQQKASAGNSPFNPWLVSTALFAREIGGGPIWLGFRVRPYCDY